MDPHQVSPAAQDAAAGHQHGPGTVDPHPAPPVDTSVAHPARRYDYWLGGKDNFAADRASADAIAAAFPSIVIAAGENRQFLRRAVTYLALEAGVRQFLDIGTGSTARPNVHEIAQGIAPTSRIVYVGNDPVVLAHARALLTSTPEGATAYVDADLRNPDTILADPALRQTLDFAQPVVLLLVAVLHFLPDADDPHGIVARLAGALPPGSHLVISHATYDPLPAPTVAKLESIRTTRAEPFFARSRQQVARVFDGLQVLPPGIVPVAEWRAADEPQPRPTVTDAPVYAALARIPTRWPTRPAAQSPHPTHAHPASAAADRPDPAHREGNHQSMTPPSEQVDVRHRPARPRLLAALAAGVVPAVGAVALHPHGGQDGDRLPVTAGYKVDTR